MQAFCMAMACLLLTPINTIAQLTPTCGQEGQQCCPPGPDATTLPCGDRDPTSFGFLECVDGVCDPCGARNEPVCETLDGVPCEIIAPLDSAFPNDAGICEPCGRAFEPPCPRPVPCGSGFLDPIGLCAFAECGVPGNTCCPSIPCGTETDGDTGIVSLFDCQNGICAPCGAAGQPECADADSPVGMYGE